jgi:hypothetical protein
MEEGILIRREGQKTLRKSDTGWPKVEKALGDRKYTVFAGHIHHYAKYIRNNRSYYMLGTTGGGSQLRGTSFGEFDHATWVTMTDQGPQLANLRLDGILEDDVSTENHQKFWRSLAFEEYFSDGPLLEGKELTLPIRNYFDFEIQGTLQWNLPNKSAWKITPENAEVILKPNAEKIMKFKISRIQGANGILPLPRLEVKFQGGEKKLDLRTLLDFPIGN